MSTQFAVLAFMAALLATLGASEALVWGMSRLGFKLGLAAGLVGLLTALGADSPEISSAASAVLSGAVDVGVGVLLGSNLFNLAALLGISGLLGGRLEVRRAVPIVDGSVSLLVTVVAVGIFVARLPGLVAVGLFAGVMAVYVILLTLGHPHRIHRLRLPARLTRQLMQLSAQVHPDALLDRRQRRVKGWLPVWFVAPALAVIVGGSVVMVTTALVLARHWQVSNLLVGTVVLAAITSLPNLYAAVRLAQRGEGATLVSEAFNSNTLNLVAGLSLPILLVSDRALRLDGGPVSLIWAVGLTIVAMAVIIVSGAVTRWGGLVIIAGYAVFLVELLR